MRTRLLTALGLCLAGFPAAARAERPPDDPARVQMIVVGVVEAVDETWELERDYYAVTIRVEEVERGWWPPRQGGPDNQLVVNCFRWSRNFLPASGAQGHRGIPEVGDRIRAYANLNGGDDRDYQGMYPHWYELLEPTPRGRLAREWGHRKTRAAVWAVTGLALLIGTASAIRRRRARAAKPVAGAGIGPASTGSEPAAGTAGMRES